MQWILAKEEEEDLSHHAEADDRHTKHDNNPNSSVQRRKWAVKDRA